ncbi:kinase-like domain-containing protein, partial [Melampsora americana]
FIENKVRILQEVKHPLISKCSKIEDYSQTSCIILEFPERGNLKQEVAHLQLLDHRIKSYILNIATVLKYIHGKNIIHCAIKLDNILLTSWDSIKITSFELATFASSHGVAYREVGCHRPWGKAPEMITQTAYNNAIDWWSLGIMLFQMVIGKNSLRGSEYFGFI